MKYLNAIAAFSLTWHSGRLLAVALLGLLASQGALAQYVWLDEKGVKQFTDTPPPPKTPKNRILKAPGVSRAPEASEQTAASAPSASATAAASASSAPLTTAERNADYIKRKQEQAEKEKKEAAEAERRQANARNCEAARANQRNLDSGVRLTQIDKNGERVIMTEEQKAQSTRENAKILEGCR